MMPDPCIVTDPSQVQLERSRKQDQFFSLALLARQAIYDTDHGLLLIRAVMEFVCNFRTSLAFPINGFYKSTFPVIFHDDNYDCVVPN